MEKISLQRIRQLLIDIHSVSDDGVISFDISKVQSLGYSVAEIDTANSILAIEQVGYLDELYKSKIVFWTLDPGSQPFLNVYYIAIANLIFIVNKKHDVYSYIFEEDLEKAVAERKDYILQLTYAMANINDVFGNPI